MSVSSIITFFIGTIFLLNLVGYVRYLTLDYWTKASSGKEITVENCENIFSLINDINHYAKASKIKVNEHLLCYQKVLFSLFFKF